MTGRNPVRLDAARGSVVLCCRDCPPWRRLASDQSDALRQQADHVERVHGMVKLAANLRDRARKLDTPG